MSKRLLSAKQQADHADHHDAPSTTTRMITAPFVGRERELSDLVAAPAVDGRSGARYSLGWKLPARV